MALLFMRYLPSKDIVLDLRNHNIYLFNFDIEGTLINLRAIKKSEKKNIQRWIKVMIVEK